MLTISIVICNMTHPARGCQQPGASFFTPAPPLQAALSLPPPPPPLAPRSVGQHPQGATARGGDGGRAVSAPSRCSQGDLARRAAPRQPRRAAGSRSTRRRTVSPCAAWPFGSLRHPPTHLQHGFALDAAAGCRVGRFGLAAARHGRIGAHCPALTAQPAPGRPARGGCQAPHQPPRASPWVPSRPRPHPPLSSRRPCKRVDPPTLTPARSSRKLGPEKKWRWEIQERECVREIREGGMSRMR